VNDNIKLKILTEKYINNDVLKWYFDKEVTKFSDNQHRKLNLNMQKQYIKNCQLSNSRFLHGIFFDNNYIGNILISNISNYHKTAEISYFIGDKRYWGKGIMTTVIKMVVHIAKDSLMLNKLYAGVASENYASIKALEKNNFIKEGKRTQHLYYNSKYYDQIDYGLLLNLK
tara:strand:+ start:561 stop:1073 length:513 start_codon:yes stop_codon:yes gene_type:complete